MTLVSLIQFLCNINKNPTSQGLSTVHQHNLRIMMSLQYAILLFVVLLASTAVRNQAIPGGWEPIKDIDDRNC
jgi:hypothetical protein